MVCKECGKNYRRITRKDGEVVWRCADRVENGKQEACKNFHTITDTEIKQAICDYLGIDYFDEDTVKEEICRIEIGSDSIEFVSQMDCLFSLSM